MRREQKLEDYLQERVEACGGLCEKFVSPGRRGVPDRLITWSGGRMDLVELKAENGQLSPEQRRDHKRRMERGVRVYLLNTREKIDKYIALRMLGLVAPDLYSHPEQ